MSLKTKLKNVLNRFSISNESRCELISLITNNEKSGISEDDNREDIIIYIDDNLSQVTTYNDGNYFFNYSIKDQIFNSKTDVDLFKEIALNYINYNFVLNYNRATTNGGRFVTSTKLYIINSNINNGGCNITFTPFIPGLKDGTETFDIINMSISFSSNTVPVITIKYGNVFNSSVLKPIIIDFNDDNDDNIILGSTNTTTDEYKIIISNLIQSIRLVARHSSFGVIPDYNPYVVFRYNNKACSIVSANYTPSYTSSSWLYLTLLHIDAGFNKTYISVKLWDSESAKATITKYQQSCYFFANETIRNIPITYNASFDLEVQSTTGLNIGNIVQIDTLKINNRIVRCFVDNIVGTTVTLTPMNIGIDVETVEAGTITKGQNITILT